MRNVLTVRGLIMGAALLSAFTPPTRTLGHGPKQQPAPTREKKLKAYLQHYVGIPKSYDNASTRYIAAFADLQDNGNEDAIVYFMDDGWCGTGGCTMLVLAPTASSYRLVTRTTITRTPIRVLSTRSHEWHDIAVWVQGGGIEQGYEAKLSLFLQRSQ